MLEVTPTDFQIRDDNIVKIPVNKEGEVILRTINNQTETVINRVIKPNGTIICVNTPLVAGDLYVTIVIDKRLKNRKPTYNCFHIMDDSVAKQRNFMYLENGKDYVPSYMLLPTDIGRTIYGMSRNMLMKVSAVIAECEVLGDSDECTEEICYGV